MCARIYILKFSLTLLPIFSLTLHFFHTPLPFQLFIDHFKSWSTCLQQHEDRLCIVYCLQSPFVLFLFIGPRDQQVFQWCLGSSLVRMGEWKRLVDYCLLLFADSRGFLVEFPNGITSSSVNRFSIRSNDLLSIRLKTDWLFKYFDIMMIILIYQWECLYDQSNLYVTLLANTR